MTDTNTNDELQALRDKNVQLLDEVKRAKAAAKEAQAALDALQAERDAAVADVRALRLDGPVDALMDAVSIDAELYRSIFGRHYQFAMDDTGAVVIQDSEGKPATIGKGDSARPATTSPADVIELAAATPDAEKLQRLRHPSGGGAVESRRVTIPKTEAKPVEAPSPYGLR